MPPKKRPRPDQAADLSDADLSPPQTIAGTSGSTKKSSSTIIKHDHLLRQRQYVPSDSEDAFADSFWSHHIGLAERDFEEAEEGEDDEQPPILTDWKSQHTLPLARIKKKLDPDVRLLATEVPILLSRACEVFIAELTTRAWINATSHKRKTLNRTDIAEGAAQTDKFDFLIDIVGREPNANPPPCPRVDKTEDYLPAPMPEPPRRSPVDPAAVAAEQAAAETEEFLSMATGANIDGDLDWSSRFIV